jgi:hypothetical protein
VSIQQQNGMAGGLQQRTLHTQLDRKVRRAAAEIDAAAEIPMRVDESHFHDGVGPPSIRNGSPRSVASHRVSPATPCRQGTGCRSPNASEMDRASDT